MKIQEIISISKEYIICGGIGAIVLLALFIIGYFVIYRKIMKGKYRIRYRKMIWWAVFLGMIYIITGYTILSDHAVSEEGGVVELLYLYKSAWIDFNKSEWLHIILGYVMFIPLGIWIPAGLKWFRNFIKTYAFGLVISIAIQFIQLNSSRGVFELDSLMANTVGTMIGYGLFAIIQIVWRSVRKHMSFDYKRLVILQIPLIITLCSFGIIAIVYTFQEKGNNPYEAIQAQDTDTFKVQLATTLSEEAEELLTYETKLFTQDEAIEMGTTMFEAMKVKVDEDRIVVDDNTVSLFSNDKGEYSLRIDLRGGTYQFYDFKEALKEVPLKKKKGADKQTIIKALAQYGVTVPDGCEFTELDDGHYQFKADKLADEEGMINGAIVCDYHGNGRFSSIHNTMSVCVPYKDYPAKSEMDAYHEIEQGLFIYDGEEKDKLNIKVKDCTTTYILDTKGYYQPVYLFECSINGVNDTLVIPAY